MNQLSDSSVDVGKIKSDFCNDFINNQVVESDVCETKFSTEIAFDQSSTCSKPPLVVRAFEDTTDHVDLCKLPKHEPCVLNCVSLQKNSLDSESNAITAETTLVTKVMRIEEKIHHHFITESNKEEGAVTEEFACKNSSETHGISTNGIEDNGKSNSCQVCHCIEAKYRCPRCEMQTCSVPCVKKHKVSSGCTGERDKLAFVDISQYNDRDLLNDYRFLEEAERKLFSNNSTPSSHRGQSTRFAPYHLGKRCKYLMNAAYSRGINLRFVHPALSKNKANTSFFTISSDTIEWHVDWIFASTNTLVKDEKVCESVVLIDAVRKFTNFTEYPHLRKNLEDYRGEKLGSCQLLLKLEGLPANRTRYFALKPSQTLGENLKGMCLIEYPTIVVMPSSEQQALESYPLLSKEDMVEMDRGYAQHMLKFYPELNPVEAVERELLNINSSLYTSAQQKRVEQLET